MEILLQDEEETPGDSHRIGGRDMSCRIAVCIAVVAGERGQSLSDLFGTGSTFRKSEDISTLIHQRMIHSESNFACGRGAGRTWSTSKLATRMARRSDRDRFVSETFAANSAPSQISWESSPQAGTDNSVRPLQSTSQDIRWIR